MSVKLHRWIKQPQGSVLADRFPKLFEHVADDETAIYYIPKFRELAIPVCDGGGSGITITHDPWSGAPLPPSLRHAWFDTVEAEGVDPLKDSVPERFQSEAWWLEKGL